MISFVIASSQWKFFFLFCFGFFFFSFFPSYFMYNYNTKFHPPHMILTINRYKNFSMLSLGDTKIKT